MDYLNNNPVETGEVGATHHYLDSSVIYYAGCEEMLNIYFSDVVLKCHHAEHGGNDDCHEFSKAFIQLLTPKPKELGLLRG